MTNREIAEKLNVSPSTLSLILNHKGNISDETRNRVLTEIKEMGYEHLIKKEEVQIRKNILFVVYKRRQTILGEKASYIFLLKGIENVVVERGYNLFLSIILEGEDVKEQVSRLMCMSSEGMILYATEMIEDDMKYFSDYAKPMVVIDNDFPHLDCTCIYSNYISAGYQAVSYLRKMGHTRIGYLRSGLRLRCFELRELGYRMALREFGMDFEEKDIWDIDLLTDEMVKKGYERKIRTCDDLPTAFVSDEDVIACEAIHCFKENGIRVPEQVSVMGYNDGPLAEKMIPPLTTICGFGTDYLHKAVSELLFEIECAGQNMEPHYGCKVMTGTALIERASVKNRNKK